LKKARIWIGIVISIIALAIAFREIDLPNAGGVDQLLSWLLPGALRSCRPAPAGGSFSIHAPGCICTLAIVNIGYLLGNILPPVWATSPALIGDLETISRTAAFFDHHRTGARCLFAVISFSSSAPVPDWDPLRRSWARQYGHYCPLCRAHAAPNWTSVCWIVSFRPCAGLMPTDGPMEPLADLTHRFVARLTWADRPISRLAGSLIDGQRHHHPCTWGRLYSSFRRSSGRT
jgi:hypothetical protein